MSESTRKAKGYAALSQDKPLEPFHFERIIIEGHTDSVGSEAYNQNLGQSRANTIRGYLIRYGNFNPGSLEAKSYGEIKPIADNGNYQGRQLNRRVVFRIYYKH